VIKRWYDAIGIELEVVGLELIALEEIELYLIERKLFAIEDKAYTLAARRLRGVVEPEGHLSSLSERKRYDMCPLHIHHEIYGHFTCDEPGRPVEWTRAQPPFSSLQA
jgi:hypothetical protein